MRPHVHGLEVDSKTRCVHWRSPLDIVAIRMKCCDRYYACKDCHNALAAHPVVRWPQREWDAEAILCGACGAELTIRAYLASANSCPGCGAPFNPGCTKHYAFYFEMESRD